MWNIYAFHCSDGDNWSYDNEAAAGAARELFDRAEIVEVVDDKTTHLAPEYQVRFNNSSTTYKTLGEAYIEAGQAVGNPV